MSRVKRRSLPSQAYLTECVWYDPKINDLRWKHRPVKHFIDEHRQKTWNTRYADKPAGHKIHRKDNYIQCVIHINYELHVRARIIWKLVYGTDPHVVDHIDGNSENNKLKNLREVTDSQSAWNRRMRSTNTSGQTGVYICADGRKKKYRAYICVYGKIKTIGFYLTMQEAVEAYKKAATALHEGYARNSQPVATI